jgi:predicted nucleic acid-binding protein
MKNLVVVDTSIAIKWAVNEPDSNMALSLLAEWTNRETVILAPALLAYEATNTLHRRVRGGEISFDDARRGLEEIIFTAVVFDFSQDSATNIKAMEFAQRFGLPAAYDSHYLALAESKGCAFWTADTRLWNTIRGKVSWVRWIGDYKPANQDISPGETEPGNT